ncbi:MAG TPA: helix-turn-helix transcriptional regulator [Cryobacterium sp.]|nr:helix-turn-helix transcriptional regulator [Cryobacterium sp.]
MPEPKSEASRVLGLRLRERRLALALNQETVAHLAGLNVSNYARIDRGQGNPTFHTLIRLAAVLGLEPSDLLVGFTAEQLPPTRDSCTALDFRHEQEALARRGRAGKPTRVARSGPTPA